MKGKESRSAQKLGWAKGANKRELANRSDQACEFRETEVGQEVDPREVYLNTLELLLERGADPNTSRVPVPVLFSAILACDREGIRRLLLWGARTDIPLPPEAGNQCFTLREGHKYLCLLLKSLVLLP